MPLVRSSASPLWCTCGIDGEHLSGFGAVCASAVTAAAALSPLVASPRAQAIASSHTVSRTPRTIGYSSQAIVSDTDVPANDGFGRIGRFVY